MSNRWDGPIFRYLPHSFDLEFKLKFSKTPVGFCSSVPIYLLKMTISDSELLRQFAQNRSEEAFTLLVKRHIDLVYSAALRQVRSPQLAEDVTQSVFSDLSQNADKLKPDTLLIAWLYRVTRRTAVDVIRSESRRQHREQIALELADMKSPDTQWKEIELFLDEAMETLDEQDRSSILLRYFENRSLREVGQALGISEDAAQKRVSRAVDCLRKFFSEQGHAVGASGFVAILSVNAVQAAPIGLAATTSSVAVANIAAGTGSTLTLFKFMAAAKFKTSLMAAIVIGSVLAPLMIRHQAQARLRDQDEALRQGAARATKLQEDNEQLSKLLSQAKSSPSLPNDQFRELLKLRGEVALLRMNLQGSAQPQPADPQSRNHALASMAKFYAERVTQFKQLFEANPSETIPEIQFLTAKNWLWLANKEIPPTEDGYRSALSKARGLAENQFVHDLLHPALQQYAKDNPGQFPGDLSQLKPYFKRPVDDAVLQRWEILPRNNLANYVAGDLKAGEDWIIAPKAPVNATLDLPTICSMKEVHAWASRPTNQWIRLR